MADKVDYIKLMHESGTAFNMSLDRPSVSVRKAVIDEAHKQGLVAVAHALTYNDTMEILSAGVDGLTHTFLDEPPTDELIRAYQKNGA